MGLLNDIKKEAAKKKVIIQTSDAEQLSKMLNKMFYLPKNIEKETQFIKQVMTRGFESQDRVGLHASALITGEKDFCLRAQVLSLIYKQVQGSQINVGLMRIFEEGNAIHEKWQRLFLRAGYAEPNQLDYTRYSEEYMVSFTPDIECNIPQFYDGPMIGEIKSVNTYQFKDMVRHASGEKQLNWYLHLTGYKKGFVLAEDKNTQEFKIFIKDYNHEEVLPFIERDEEIKYRYHRAIEDGKMVGRPADAKTSTCKRCLECAMRDACWNIGMGRQKIMDDNWDD